MRDLLSEVLYMLVDRASVRDAVKKWISGVEHSRATVLVTMVSAQTVSLPVCAVSFSEIACTSLLLQRNHRLGHNLIIFVLAAKLHYQCYPSKLQPQPYMHLRVLFF